MVIVVLDSVVALLVNSPFALVHSSVIYFPLLSEYVSFLIHLAFEVVAQFLELILKLRLKLINDIMNMIHTVDSLLPILSNLRIGIIKLLLHLPLVLLSSWPLKTDENHLPHPIIFE